MQGLSVRCKLLTGLERLRLQLTRLQLRNVQTKMCRNRETKGRAYRISVPSSDLCWHLKHAKHSRW